MEDLADPCFCLQHLIEVLNCADDCRDPDSLCWFLNESNEIERTDMACQLDGCFMDAESFSNVLNGTAKPDSCPEYMLLRNEHSLAYKYASTNPLDKILPSFVRTYTCDEVKKEVASNTYITDNSLVVIGDKSVSKFYFVMFEDTYVICNREIVIATILNGITELRKYVEFPSVLHRYEESYLKDLNEKVKNSGRLIDVASLMFPLKGRVPRFSTPDNDVDKTLTSLTRCIAYLHSCGFTHGDIKVGNHLYTEDGEVKLVDIGNCNLLVDIGNMYTPGFEAPELLNGWKKYIDQACDVYALGVVIIEFISGVKYDKDMKIDNLKSIIDKKHHKWLKIAILCLSSDQYVRPTSAIEVMALIGETPVISKIVLPCAKHIVVREDDVVNPVSTTFDGDHGALIALSDLLYSTLYRDEGKQIKNSDKNSQRKSMMTRFLTNKA